MIYCLIGERVVLMCYRNLRYWFVDNQHHRNDGGPAIEDTDIGRRWWWENGKFARWD